MSLFGGRKRVREVIDDDVRYDEAREAYFNGRVKVVTTESLPGRDVRFVFGLVVSRGYNPDNAFFGMIKNALDAGADAILGYRENVSFHPEGEKYYACYGTAIVLETSKRVRNKGA